MSRVLIFDGTNTFIRNFVVNPTSDINGNPIGGLLGTIRSIKFMIAETKPSRVIFVWDGKGGAQRRRGVISEYKMGRKPRLNREVDENTSDSKNNMDWQRSKLKSILGFLGVSQIEVDNIEADDTIGYLCGLLEGTQKVIVSSDRDMWQLVGPTTKVYWPTKKIFITQENFNEVSDILPGNFILARALSGAGDASDNIHGIAGLGGKTITKLFPEFCKEPLTLDALLKIIRDRLEADSQGITKPKLKPTEKRWYSEILSNEFLVRRNIEVMQLSTPNISAQAAGIIKSVAEQVPSFNISGFKLALLNNNIQLTDNDIFTIFNEYKVRATNEAH